MNRWLKSLQTPLTFLRLAYRADPWTALQGVALLLLGVACLGLISVALKGWVNATTEDSGQIAVLPAILFAASLGVPTMVDRGMIYTGWTLAERTMGVLEKRLMEITAAIPTVEHLERPDYLRELELLSQSRGALAGIVDTGMINASVTIRIVTLGAILASVHPLLLALPLFMVAPLITAARARRRRLVLMDRLAEDYRRERYYEALAVTKDPAREVRLFRLGPELLRRFLTLGANINRQVDRERLIGSLIGILGWLIFASAYLGALFFVADLASSGHANLGDMVIAITVAVQLAFLAAQLAGTGPWLMNTIKAGWRYAWLVDYAEGVAKAVTWPERQLAPSALRDGITLENVSFRYGEEAEAAVSCVSLHLPAGSIVAVVGENGAGKSTLVKLLSRMYEPSSGRILVDGVDLRAFDVEGWRTRLAAGFQDFMRFEFLAGETVGVGDLPFIDDQEAVELALARAGATELVEGLPKGLHTQLGKSFDGAELSGGQWQKIALARSMMRSRPLLVVLDEPTAALDTEAEYGLFQRYAIAARDAAQHTGAITVLVTHRFSNVRMCDRIAVLGHGRLLEYGSHAELLAAGGTYADLYEMQARQYR